MTNTLLLVSKEFKLLASNKTFFSFPGLRGTIRIGKLYNDTEKVKELMLWWSSNVGERISKLQQNISLDCKDNETCRGLQSQPIKGNIYRSSISFSIHYLYAQ